MQYEKEFNISLTRISSTEKEIQRSMLAYSDKMRNLNKSRYHQSNKERLPDASSLQIRARHIPKSLHLPKISNTTRKLNQKRHPKQHEMKRDNDSNSPEENNLRQTYPLTSSFKRGHGSKEQMKLNFASAADLCELADYRLTRRGRNNALPPVTNGYGSTFHLTDVNNDKQESDNKIETCSSSSNKEVTSSPKTGKVKDVVEKLDNKTMVKAIVKLRDIDRKLSQASFNSRKYKKMRLAKSKLVAIPETDYGEEEEEETDEHSFPSTIVMSQSTDSMRSSGSGTPVSLKPNLDAIMESDTSTCCGHSNSISTDNPNLNKGELISDSDMADKVDLEMITPVIEPQRETSNVDRARKQMKQRAKHKKIKFLKAV